MVTTPSLAITMGDPAGIGPEVIAKSLKSQTVYEQCSPIVIGSVEVMEDALRLACNKASVRHLSTVGEAVGQYGSIDVLDHGYLNQKEINWGHVSAAAGKASVEWVCQASDLASREEIAGIVTGPINKAACKLAGFEDIGHMEILQRRNQSEQVATMLMADNLRVVHLTTHKSLQEACKHVTKENVFSMITLTYKSFLGWGFPTPKIGVAALNPHGSDGGLIGNEEKKQIAPAIAEAQTLGINVTGPVPADTIFNEAIHGLYDVVLAMYHDQGHIPIKMHNRDKSISVNLGLPFLRTSVDHGTAFDIAGKGIANHESMLEAISVAVDILKEGKLR